MEVSQVDLETHVKSSVKLLCDFYYTGCKGEIANGLWCERLREYRTHRRLICYRCCEETVKNITNRNAHEKKKHAEVSGIVFLLSKMQTYNGEQL